MNPSEIRPVEEPGERLRILFQKGDVDVNKNVPIRRYFRSCQELIRMAGVYFDEKNLETSYIYYAKFIVLSFEKLKTHPQYNNATPDEKAANKKALKNIAFPRAEKLKGALKKMYEDEYVKYKKEVEKMVELARLQEENQRIEDEKKKDELESIKNQKEMEKKQREKEEMDAFYKERRRKELELERLAIEKEFGPQPAVDDTKPLVPVEIAPPPPIQLPVAPPPPTGLPIVPPSELSANKVVRKPSFDRSLKPASHPINNTISDKDVAQQISTAFAASLTLSENRYGLRTILSPSELPSKFMNVAHSNTAKNIETCGVLFGKVANEVFVITHVLVPHQKGAPDSCQTTREEDMWDFQDQYDGICLGWIHTHPSQTAFLSSVDLHTHYPYQCLMPESVAIVCSGKYKEIGYFMLTPGRGMDLIGKCQVPGFHPHPSNPPLFEACDHVKPSPAHTVQIIDWRNK